MEFVLTFSLFIFIHIQRNPALIEILSTWLNNSWIARLTGFKRVRIIARRSPHLGERFGYNQ